MLSTLDETHTGVDGLIPDSEVSVKLSRNKLNELEHIVEASQRLENMVQSALQKVCADVFTFVCEFCPFFSRSYIYKDVVSTRV